MVALVAIAGCTQSATPGQQSQANTQTPARDPLPVAPPEPAQPGRLLDGIPKLGGRLQGSSADPNAPDAMLPDAPECSAAERTCDENRQLRCQDGLFVPGPACPFLCQDGECRGVCIPGAALCDGQQPRACDATGAWVTGSPCPFVCSDGQCLGQCVPGDTRCQGLLPQTCDEGGEWVSGQVQANVCAAQCTPGDRSCLGTTPQTCSDAGVWEAQAITPGACGAVCSPGALGCVDNTTTPRRCNSLGLWVPEPIVRGRCGADCTPGTPSECDGERYRTCQLDGTWDAQVVGGQCGAVCSPGQTSCGAHEDPSYLGTCLNDGCGYIWTAPNNVYRAHCDARGQWVDMGLCTATCLLISGVASGSQAHYCQMRAGQAMCLSGGNCPE